MEIEINSLNWYGRTLDNDGIRYFDYSSSGFSFVLTGKKAEATFVSDPKSWDETAKAVLGIYISETDEDSWKTFPDEPTFRCTLNQKETECVLFESEEEKTVCIRVVKLSEAAFGYAGLKAIAVEGKIQKSVKNFKGPKIEFIGDSITCGYGIDGVWSETTHFSTQTERADKSYAFLTSKKMDSEFQCCSWSGIGITSNYVDPETVNLPYTAWLMPANWPYTDKSLSLRLKLEPEVWDQKRFSPDIVVIHLGTNDISWVRDVEARRLNFVAQYRQLIEAVHRRSPSAKICCILGVMGESLNKSVQEAVDLFSKDFPKVTIKTVFCHEQDEKDGIAIDWHPSAKTHKKVADRLVKALKDM